MINKIKYTKELQPFIKNECEENKIFVRIADDIPPSNYLVIKVDDYYNSLKRSDTPPSIDCLIPLKCSDNSFVVYLIELRNVKTPHGFDKKKISNKFKTVIDNFMSKRFKNIFLNERYKIKKLQLFFVTNPYRQKEEERRKEGTKMEYLLLLNSFRFRGKKYQISHKLPNPLIKNC